ncbi:MAG: T9SS type A sorting domain-containing protein [Bacteroidia bacterium]
MKKIFTLITIFTISITGLWAQADTASSAANWKATPNPGLQDWTSESSFFGNYEDPDGWNTSNPQTASIGEYCVTQLTSGTHTGSYAAKLTTLDIVGNMAPGIMTTGTIPTSTSGNITGGIAYTLRPDSIVGWFEYTPASGDNCFAECALFSSSANTDTIAIADFSTKPNVTVSTWTRFSAPFVYRSSSAVANSLWLICSSGNSTGVTNSTMNVQDLAIIINKTTGIAEQTNPGISVTMSPNPATNHVVVNTSKANTILSLYDIAGRKVSEQKLYSGDNIIDVNAFNNGLYIYTVTDENSPAVSTGKLIIQK